MSRSSSSLRAATVLLVALLAAGCKRTDKPEPTLQSKVARKLAARPSPWSQLLAAKSGKGWFTLSTADDAQPAPLSGKRCAYFRLLITGTPETNPNRFHFDEWPTDSAVLRVDGAAIAVATTSLTLELPPSATREYRPTDAHLPERAVRMFAPGKWVGADDTPPPARITATEHCLAPATSYRAELRRHEPSPLAVQAGARDPAFYQLAIAPAP